ncbi:hypothetical protein BG006_009376 [Podila minutissima]|uniref:F-box domain-containing protein n=1 Tax=Podila minutissima TaxID=64525 RepID=A0A9P5VPP4_9FUNG|nr:hypothetical protein BG006_009376 [Podila minutissima]
MDVPEIRTQIGLYLDTSELNACAKVCRSWYDTFFPLIWADFEWQSDYSVYPQSKALEQNARHIRYLRLTDHDRPAHFLDLCANLRDLVLMFAVHEHAQWDQISQLVHRNKKLFSINISTGGLTPTTGFIQAVAQNESIKQIEITFSEYDRSAVTALLDAGARLETLSVIGAAFEDPGSMTRWQVSGGGFPRLKSLQMCARAGITARHQFELIQQCPQLDSLTWSEDSWTESGQSFPTTEFCQMLTHNCPNLAVFELQIQSLTDKDLSRILDSARRVTSFQVFDTQFGPAAFQSLFRHFRYVTKLDLRRCPEVTSAMSQQILESCPGLIEFFAGYLKVQDMKPEQEWVCTGLTSISLFICGLRDQPPEKQEAVLRQLAKLERIESLTVGTFDPRDENSRDGLDLRLSVGLSILEPVKELRWICFDGLAQEMDETDLTWMVETWPKLCRLEGKVHTERERRLELQEILIDKGVALVGYMDDEEEEDEDIDLDAATNTD